MNLNPNISLCRRVLWLWGQTIAKRARYLLSHPPAEIISLFVNTLPEPHTGSQASILFVKATEWLFLALFNSYLVVLFKIKTLIGQKKSAWSWPCAFQHQRDLVPQRAGNSESPSFPSISFPYETHNQWNRQRLSSTVVRALPGRWDKSSSHRHFFLQRRTQSVWVIANSHRH